MPERRTIFIQNINGMKIMRMDVGRCKTKWLRTLTFHFGVDKAKSSLGILQAINHLL